MIANFSKVSNFNHSFSSLGLLRMKAFSSDDPNRRGSFVWGSILGGTISNTTIQYKNTKNTILGGTISKLQSHWTFAPAAWTVWPKSADLRITKHHKSQSRFKTKYISLYWRWWCVCNIGVELQLLERRMVATLCLLDSIHAVGLQCPQPQTIQLHTLYIMALSTKQYKYIQGVPGKVSLRMFLNWTASSDIVSPLIDSSQEHERACPHSTNSEGYFFLGHPIYCVFTREITQTRTQWPHSPILLQHNATGLTEPQASSISSQIGNTTTKLWLFVAQLSCRHNVILFPSVTSSHSEAAQNSCHKNMDCIWISASISCTNQKYSPIVSPKPPCCTAE